MAASTMQATRIAGAPRWRALAVAIALVGAAWATGFGTGRMTAGSSVATVGRVAAVTVPTQVSSSSGTHKGVIRLGTGIIGTQGGKGVIRPGNHGGGTVKGA